MSWPGSIGEAAFAFEDRNGSVPGAAQQGPWALFRLLDHSLVEKVSDTQFRVTLAAGGKSMRATLEAASIRNPFGHNELSGFRCSM
jgi:type VI secretion system protein ImpL